LAYVHLRATSCRCHRRIVSGVTIEASWRNARRPNRCPRTASRCRSSSLSRSRRPRSCPAGCGSLRSDTPGPLAAVDPTSRSERREGTAGRARQPRRESVSHRPRFELQKPLGRVMGHYALDRTRWTGKVVTLPSQGAGPPIQSDRHGAIISPEFWAARYFCGSQLSGDQYGLSFHHHARRWEPTPFTGDVGRLASVVMTEFGAYLDSYDFLPTKSGSDH
jgi:hypothetical protein